jgi:hypothetical protein
MGVAGLGDGWSRHSIARPDQAEIGHELARVGEAGEVAEFRDQHNGIDQCDPPHHLQAVDNGAQSPFGEESEDLLLDSLQTLFRPHDGIDIVLKCDLLSGMFEGQSG